MYLFCNKINLPTLSASGEENEVVFTTPTEKAVIILNNDTIEKVVHTDLLNNNTVTISYKDSHHIVVGAANCQRDVYHYLLPTSEAHLQLRLGITVHCGEGTWSSLPHDFENDPENDFEEIFFYILSDRSKKAIQVGKGLWPDGSQVDDIWHIRDREFGAVPMGYHPVVGEPGVKVSYIWGYLAKKPEWEKVKND